jgi:hypothetical protein
MDIARYKSTIGLSLHQQNKMKISALAVKEIDCPDSKLKLSYDSIIIVCNWAGSIKVRLTIIVLTYKHLQFATYTYGHIVSTYIF